MARKKIVVERKPMKVKRTRKITEEQREALRQRMIEMRKKRKPAEYKNVSKVVLALPEEDEYSFKNVKRDSSERFLILGVSEYNRWVPRKTNKILGLLK